MRKVKHKNGRRYSLAIKQGALNLRQRGKTHREITKILNIGLGSAALWTKGAKLTVSQKEDIQRRRNRHKFSSKEKVVVLKRLKPFQFQKKYSNEDLINKIKEFYIKNRRIPLKQEFNSLRIFRERFGSWNNAIKKAGFSPNPVLFSKKFVANDRHSCDSFTEKIIDDWLFERGIKHRRHVPYPGTRMTVDFLCGKNIFLEFFGLAGVQKQYDALLEKKRKFCKQRGIRLIEIYPKDVFPQNRLPSIISEIMVKNKIPANY